MQITKRSLLVTLVALMVSACSNATLPSASLNSEKVASKSPSSESCHVVKHDIGATRVCGQPQRLAVLDPHMLDLSLSLGIQPAGYAEVDVALGDRIALGQPIKWIKYLGDRVTSSPINIGTRAQPSIESILRLKPDLILGEIGNLSLYAKLSEIAPTLLPSTDFENYQWQQSLLKIAPVFEREQRAKQVIEEYNQRIAKARRDLAPIASNSRVLLLVMPDLGNIGVFTNKTFAGALLEEIGLRLTIPQQPLTGLDEISISLETLPQLDADTIFVMLTGYGNNEKVKTDWKQHPLLRSLHASKAGRIYFIDYQLWGRIRGPIAAELIVDEVRQLLLSNSK